jgi:hypothetical protein
MPFFSFFFYFAPGRDAPAVLVVVFHNESGASRPIHSRGLMVSLFHQG